MTPSLTDRPPIAGAAWALVGVALFSANDVLIKFLSGDYALHQIVLIRSGIGILFLMAVIVPLTGGLAQLRTRRPWMHILRGICVVIANVTFFLALAAMPLAEAVAIFFVSPLLISLFSVVFLGEKVGPRRWAAIAAGLVGVGIVLRPGTDAFQIAALLPLAAALAYAILQTITRRIGGTENATSLAFSIQAVFLVTSAAFGLALGHGGFAGSEHPSLDFLFRAWAPPPAADLGLMALLGVVGVLGGWAISQAYRLSEAALVAPVEYAAMPLAVFWGYTIFGDWPDAMAWAGIALILGAGLVLIWREAVDQQSAAIRPPAR